MSPKALGLSEVKEDLFLCTFGCWVGEPLPGEGGGMPTTLLGFSIPPSRSLTAQVSYWAGTGPPEPRSLSALSLETQKQPNTGSWTAQSQAGHGGGGEQKGHARASRSHCKLLVEPGLDSGKITPMLVSEVSSEAPKLWKGQPWTEGIRRKGGASTPSQGPWSPAGSLL